MGESGVRLKAKVDNNHKAIVDAFRSCGWLVLSLAPVGQGVPDLLISKHGHMRLVEVKGKRGKLTEQQMDFIKSGWPVDVVRSVGEALILTMEHQEAL
jgi:hypothetical protein